MQARKCLISVSNIHNFTSSSPTIVPAQVSQEEMFGVDADQNSGGGQRKEDCIDRDSRRS